MATLDSAQNIQGEKKRTPLFVGAGGLIQKAKWGLAKTFNNASIFREDKLGYTDYSRGYDGSLQYKGAPIEGINHEHKFQYIEKSGLAGTLYITDREVLIYFGHVVKGFNAKIFKRDGDYIYNDRMVVYNGNVVTPVDIESFHVFNRPGKDRFASDGTRIFYEGRVIPEVNAKKFELLDGLYATDRKVALWLGKVITGADGIVFRTIGDHAEFAADDDSVFRDNIELDGADPVYFKSLGGNFGKDNSQVWYADRKIENVDANSFTYIGQSYGKDKDNVVYCSKSIPQLDPETFQALDASYGKDNTYVVHEGQIIEDADNQTFTTLRDGSGMVTGFAKDKKRVYYHGEVLRGLNPETFAQKQGSGFEDGWEDDIYKVAIVSYNPVISVI